MKRNLSIIAAIFAGIVLSGSAIAKFQGKFNSRIAFLQYPDLFSMNPDGTDVRQLTNLGSNNSADWENWSPDGRQLVFVEYPNNGPGQLWLMNSDGSHQHLFLSEAEYGEFAPSFSPDGAWVIFTRCQNESNGNGCAIYKVRTDGCCLTPISDFRPDTNDWEPVYSPDGMLIAFDSFERDGRISVIWVMNADGSDIRPLTPPKLLGVNPQWSPDGDKIVFKSHCCNPQNNDVWVINRNGDDLTRLTGSAATDFDIPVSYYDQGPSWSPDSRAIAFSQYVPATNTQAIFVFGAGNGGMEAVKLKETHPRVNAQTSIQELHRKRKRHHFPREIENGGNWPRWSPKLQ